MSSTIIEEREENISMLKATAINRSMTSTLSPRVISLNQYFRVLGQTSLKSPKGNSTKNAQKQILHVYQTRLGFLQLIVFTPTNLPR